MAASRWADSSAISSPSWSSERVGLLLRHGGRFRGNVRRASVGVLPARLLIQSLASRGQHLQEYDTHLRRQPPPERHHAVLVLIHMQRPAPVASGRLGRLGLPVYPAPAADDAFDVIGRARAPDGQQTLFRLRRGHAGQSLDLGVRELAPRQAWASRGSVPSARATRTRSRAAPRSSPTRQLSQAAQERKPVFQPSRASNSRIRSRRCAVAASRWAESPS